MTNQIKTYTLEQFLLMSEEDIFEVFNTYALCNNMVSEFFCDKKSENGSYLWIHGDVNIAITAHVDTVDSWATNVVTKRLKTTNENGRTKLTAVDNSRFPTILGGDDRVGVYLLWKILTETAMRPHILLFDGEESGGVGSLNFIKDHKTVPFNYIFSMDMPGKNKFMWYSYQSKQLIPYMENKGFFNDGAGIFTDIYHLCREYCNLQGVVMTVGYYKQHTHKEYIILEDVEHSFNQLKEILAEGSIGMFGEQYEQRSGYECYEFKEYTLEDVGHSFNQLKLADRRLK